MRRRYIALLAGAAVLATGAALFGPARAQLGSASPVASSVSLATTSAQLLAANGSRHGLTFYNQSGQVISVAPGAAAVTASGGGTINIAANGGMLTITCSVTLPCGNAWQGIAAGGSGNVLSIWEY